MLPNDERTNQRKRERQKVGCSSWVLLRIGGTVGRVFAKELRAVAIPSVDHLRRRMLPGVFGVLQPERSFSRTFVVDMF